MIYVKLFLAFLRVGTFSFGGAYGAIPLIREVVLSNGWITEDQLAYMIALSETTPGPIMVNMATYVGNVQGGVPGAAAATLGVVLPSFCIILLLMVILTKLLQQKVFQAMLSGLKPCVAGMILATGLQMVAQNLLTGTNEMSLNPSGNFFQCLDVRAIFVTGILITVMLLWQKIKGQKISPIWLIGLSAVMGGVVYGI